MHHAEVVILSDRFMEKGLGDWDPMELLMFVGLGPDAQAVCVCVCACVHVLTLDSVCFCIYAWMCICVYGGRCMYAFPGTAEREWNGIGPGLR